MKNDRSVPARSRSAAGIDAGFAVIVLALIVVIAVIYGDNLLDVLDGLLSFSTGGLLVLAISVIISIAFALIPALSEELDSSALSDGPAVRGTARQNRALDILYSEKVRLLRAIRDMDFDYDVGKLTDSIYADQRVYLVRQALAVLRRIDLLETEIQAQQDRIEAALAAYRQQH